MLYKLSLMSYIREWSCFFSHENKILVSDRNWTQDPGIGGKHLNHQSTAPCLKNILGENTFEINVSKSYKIDMFWCTVIQYKYYKCRAGHCNPSKKTTGIPGGIPVGSQWDDDWDPTRIPPGIMGGIPGGIKKNPTRIPPGSRQYPSGICFNPTGNPAHNSRWDAQKSHLDITGIPVGIPPVSQWDIFIPPGIPPIKKLHPLPVLSMETLWKNLSYSLRL